MSRSILVIHAHPRPDRSRANRVLRRAAEGIEDVTVLDLYAEYPAYDIDVDAEQARLAEHDVIVFQHPVYWYAAPALVKEWIDLVLEWGWAYGPGGDALKDKITFHAVTAGGRDAAYSVTGRNRFDMRALFTPFEQTALLCGMVYLPPLVLYEANDLLDDEALDAHASLYARILRGLREDQFDLAEAVQLRRLGALLEPRRVEVPASEPDPEPAATAEEG